MDRPHSGLWSIGAQGWRVAAEPVPPGAGQEALRGLIAGGKSLRSELGVG